jgi:hypothetical protein
LRLTGENFRIPARFGGPDGSANGGYAAGRIAAYVDAPAVEVTLRAPPPLERPLAVRPDGDGVRVLHGDLLVAEARPGELDVEPPRVSPDEALAATGRYTGFEAHEFPRCFVCGPLREPGDGLRIFPGVVRPGLVAAPWTAREVAREIVWAAIDCPGAFATGAPGRGGAVLGRMTARVDRLPSEGEACVALGWSLGGNGRKLDAATALLGADGRPCAVARQVWIEPRSG